MKKARAARVLENLLELLPFYRKRSSMSDNSWD
jgi:hypothetical protein